VIGRDRSNPIRLGAVRCPSLLLGKRLGSTDRASKLPQKDHFFGQRVRQPPLPWCVEYCHAD